MSQVIQVHFNMSKRSDSSNLIVIIILAFLGGICWLFKAIWETFGKSSTSKSDEEQKLNNQQDLNNLRRLEELKSREEQRKMVVEEARKKQQEEEKMRFEELKKRVSSYQEKDLIFDENVNHFDKIKLLRECFNYSHPEAKELLETAEKEVKRAKLQKAKKAISRKAFELYGGIPSDDKRVSIPDEIKQYVWQRDKGQCVKCQSHEDLEFDHIIPVSKGGSNTARNIQVFCQGCNRSKSDEVV